MRLRTQERTRIEKAGGITHKTDLAKSDVWAEVIEEKPKNNLRIMIGRWISVFMKGNHDS